MHERILDAIYYAVLDGNAPAAAAETQQALDAGLTAESILYQGCIPAMDEVGCQFEIGENLAIMMMEGAGFRIVALDADAAPEKFVEAVTEEHPGIVAMSALLTTTRSIKAAIKALEEASLRKQVKIVVAGAPVTQEFADKVGAGGFAPVSGSAVRKAKELIAA